MKAVRVRLGKGGGFFAVRRAVSYAQELVCQYVAANRSLADERIRERREGAADE